MYSNNFLKKTQPINYANASSKLTRYHLQLIKPEATNQQVHNFAAEPRSFDFFQNRLESLLLLFAN